MFVKTLEYQNYRNLADEKLVPSDSINVICGDNAQGKTNLLECLWLFTGGRSFRGSKENEMIAFGEKEARIRLEFHSMRRDQTIEITISGGKRKAVLNEVPKSYMSQIIGNFCAVVFSPDHLTLVKSGPEERRNFIDGAICQIKPAYAYILSKYRRVLNERNALLKDIPRHRELEDTIDIWNEKLAVEGAAVAFERINYLNKLTPEAISFYNGISDSKEALSLSYKMNYSSNDKNQKEIASDLLESIKKKQNDDIFCGYTTVGPHRDDLTVMINNREARIYGSQGQQRSAVLSLKLAEASVLGKEKKESPVILLDDVLSELDPSRQDYLLKKLNGMQVFITCCDKAAADGNIIFMNGGRTSVGG